MSVTAARFLCAGELGLPVPAVLMMPGQLAARLHHPRTSGFRALTGPDDWGRLTSRSALSVALRAGMDGLTVDLGPHSVGQLTLLFGRGRHRQWCHDVLSRQQVIVATADVAVYWAHHLMHTAAIFTDVFPFGSRAALARVIAPQPTTPVV